MTIMRGRGLLTVNQVGAGAGCVLSGSGLSNQGLRVRVLREQARGEDGPIKGGFVILDVGHNRHSESLEPLLDQLTDAEHVLGVIRRRHAGCVNVVNTNLLTVAENAGVATAPLE